MRVIAAVLAVLGALLVALLVVVYLITGDGDQRGVVGLLLLTAVGLFLQHHWLYCYASESTRLLAQRVCRLEEQCKASQKEPTAQQSKEMLRPR